jgi:hypothetical protein
MAYWEKWWRELNAWISKALRSAALFSIMTYRLFLSGLVGGTCRFQPTCSAYAQEAFETHPPLQAFWLTLRRLGKCHPLGPFGPDPVPERKTI